MFDTLQIYAFNRLKQLVPHTQTLTFFHKYLPISSTFDASKLGLGAMLEQLHGTVLHPTTLASRSLIVAEQNYSQIKERHYQQFFRLKNYMNRFMVFVLLLRTIRSNQFLFFREH